MNGDFSGIELTVVDEVGRDPVTIGEDYQFLTQLSNDVQYRAIAPICNADPITRCGKMALLQLLNKESKTEENQTDSKGKEEAEYSGANWRRCARRKINIAIDKGYPG